MTVIGYARVSTTDEDLTIQEEALRAAGCDVIRSEKVSGTSTSGRDELKTLMEFLREGDTLCITRIDRLARSTLDLQTIAHDLRRRGIHLKATEQPIDTSTAAGKAFFDMLGVFAEFETNLRKERQMEGIAKAKAHGKYKGRKPTVPIAEVRRLSGEGKGPGEIAEALGVSRMSVWRALRGEAASCPPASTESPPTSRWRFPRRLLALFAGQCRHGQARGRHRLELRASPRRRPRCPRQAPARGPSATLDSLVGSDRGSRRGCGRGKLELPAPPTPARAATAPRGLHALAPRAPPSGSPLEQTPGAPARGHGNTEPPRAGEAHPEEVGRRNGEDYGGA